MLAVIPVPLLADTYRAKSADEEGLAALEPVPALPHPDEAEVGKGSAVEVQLAGGVWYRGRLAGRIEGSNPPRWRVHFDDLVLTT